MPFVKITLSLVAEWQTVILILCLLIDKTLSGQLLKVGMFSISRSNFVACHLIPDCSYCDVVSMAIFPINCY